MIELAVWQLILLICATVLSVRVSYRSVARGCKQLNRPVDLLLVMFMTLLFISVVLTGMFLVELVISTLMPV